MAAGLPRADDRDTAGKGFQPPDVIVRSNEASLRCWETAVMRAWPPTQTITAASPSTVNAISEGDGGR